MNPYLQIAYTVLNTTWMKYTEQELIIFGYEYAKQHNLITTNP